MYLYFRNFTVFIVILYFLPQLSAQEYLPSEVPDRVVLTWKDDPARSRAVTWRTDTTASNSRAEIALASGNPEFTLKVNSKKADSEMLDVDGVKALYHSVNFSRLKPSTKYAYRVGNDSAWSEWFHFTTASDEEEPFSFIYFGDAQNNIKSLWSRAIREAYSQAPQADFMIHAGDLVNRGNADREWGEWFYAGGWIYGMMSSLPTPGNHEYIKTDEEGTRILTPHWKPVFTLPENGPEEYHESVYYIDYQGTRFISLNSQGFFVDEALQEVQSKWLEKVLSNNPNRWTIVTHHHPIYSPAYGRDNLELRDAFKPLYDKYGVDLVLQGHDHTYGRGGNDANGKMELPSSGPMYVVSVSGPKMYPSGFADWMDRAATNLQLFQIVNVNSDSIQYQAFTVAGELYDAFTLKREADGSNTFFDRTPADVPLQADMPARYYERLDSAEVEEYQKRFREFKARLEKGKGY